MNEIIEKLKNDFKEIKKMEWIEGKYSGTANVGKTFESLLGVEDNTFEIPDYEGIEIKTKRAYSRSHTTLFSMTPTGKYYHEVERLKDEYGYPDFKLKEFKVLNNSIFCNRRTWIGTKFQFMLKIDRKEQKIFLVIFDLNNNIIESDVYWDFDTLKEKLYRKMKIVAFVSALRKFVNGKEFFKYYKMEIYHLKDFDDFINLIEEGIICINFKLGIYREGIRKGQINDHGTSFKIKKEDFEKLFVKSKTIY